MEIAAPLPAAAGAGAAPARYSHRAKIGALLLLVGGADWLFFDQGGGSTWGAWTLALLALLLATVPPARRGTSRAAVAAAALFALALTWDPSILALALFWAAASLAMLLPKARFDNGWHWALRLLWQALRAFIAPAADGRRVDHARARHPSGLGGHIKTLALPLAGTAVFLALFATANPVLGDAFARLDVALIFASLTLSRIAFWLLVALPLWALFRPKVLRFERGPATADADLPLPSAASVTLSLLAFNLVFALQNGMDIAFLWSGARLPDGMTLAGYAHRGAYPLMATALLAGLFVLVTLRPRSPLAESAAIRRLVYLWIGQNVLLVASTVLRTLDYVDAYSLTRLRIAALIWMGLVAVGLVLICWRIWKGRSGAWLINANCAAASLALTACTVVDLGAVAAEWNVRHAGEAGGHGAALDICYMEALGPSALLPLVELERQPLAPSSRARVEWVRNLILDRLEPAQANWRLWTARNALRLSEARAGLAEARLPRRTAARQACDPALTAGGD
ncbi:MAG: DUF4173 domain-containing protein [Alphaproteobacteria bacterium]|nr:DUF4173 domain-containing protein [Alphaproteobacteria bacterium]